VEFRILGPFEVIDGDRPLELAAGKRSALLALLLIHAGAVVSSERLIDDLWGDEVPDSASKMVQIFVSQLRKKLPPGLIETRAPGYSLRLNGHTLDLREFERRQAAGREAFEDGRVAEAAAMLRQALEV
jgi:DNA-binding SARP family transcriptional activator